MCREAAAALVLGAFAVEPAVARERPSVAPCNMQAIAPGLAGYTDGVLFGDVWLRPELSPRDRSLVTLSALVATGRTAQMAGHLGRGLDNGIKPPEVAGLVTQLAFYTGWPNAVSALNIVAQTFRERKIDTPATYVNTPRRPPRAAISSRQEAVAPKLAELTDTILLGDLWKRTDLAARDRSLVTIAALAANGETAQLAEQITRGISNGLTRIEIEEAFTHLAFYAGWPRAVEAVGVAWRVFGESQDADAAAASALQIIPAALASNRGPASNFTGTVTVTSAFKDTGAARLGGATVHFEPSARSNWHSHPLGQLLVVTAGQGWVQAEGEPVQVMRAGDTVWTAPGVKHWHGATRTSAVTHVAISEASDGTSVTWLEPVSDVDYKGPE